jgi:prepilin peptidase CpaA
MANAGTPALCVFAATAIYYDLRHRRVPNLLVLAFLAGGCALLACGGWSALGRGLQGMLCGFLVLLPAFFLRMVGGGDVKSLAVIGLLAGPGLLWPAFLLGSSAAGVAGIVSIGARRVRRRVKARGHVGSKTGTIPYAAFLSISAVACALVS